MNLKFLFLVSLLAIAFVLFGCTSAPTVCGDSFCSAGEDNVSCANDCGSNDLVKASNDFIEKSMAQSSAKVSGGCAGCSFCEQDCVNGACVTNGKHICNGSGAQNTSSNRLCCAANEACGLGGAAYGGRRPTCEPKKNCSGDSECATCTESCVNGACEKNNSWICKNATGNTACCKENEYCKTNLAKPLCYVGTETG